MNFETTVERESATVPGARFRVRRMTFGRRIELTKRVRELARRIEFAEAGETFADKVEASLLSLEVDRLYLDWGLESVRGLTVDGEAVSRENATERAPEALTREMIAAVKSECGLSEDERKN